MCNLYSLSRGQAAILAMARAMDRPVADRTGNMPALPSIYPDYQAPILRNAEEGVELAYARWGMPSPALRAVAANSRNEKPAMYWSELGLTRKAPPRAGHASVRVAAAHSAAAKAKDARRRSRRGEEVAGVASGRGIRGAGCGNGADNPPRGVSRRGAGRSGHDVDAARD